MMKIFFSIIFAFLGIILKGLLNLSLAELLLILMIPVIIIYKISGSSKTSFAYAAFIAAFAGGLSALWAYIIVPIQYYHAIWGLKGIVVGIIATILLPLQFFLFLFVALFKGGAFLYICKFFAGIFFGLSGFFAFKTIISK